PLPKPWGDHIVAEQYHKSQFGKAKSEPINKNTWVFRDPLVFGCYQSISLHNSGLKLAKDVETDFGDKGKIKKDVKKMNLLERIALFACLLFSIISVFRTPKVEAFQEVSSSSSSDNFIVEQKKVSKEENPAVNVLYGRFRYYELNGDVVRLFVDGIEYKQGQLTTAGTVLSANKDGVHIMDETGANTFIYPNSGHLFEPFKVDSSTVKTSKDSSDGSES
ncbi:hypothetical protein P4E94_19495, partial [Pontiellaceae bacterium B12219]|nr:hypothetical protein [Pontiellaceae bacterium B12219]